MSIFKKQKEMKNVSHHQTSLLLHNKFVLVLGDSIQRGVYKDLVLLLQKEQFLRRSHLRTKGERSFEQDCLVEGGCLTGLNNGTAYREVRQYQSDHHLVRFYFVTRIYSYYMQTILNDIRKGLKPDCIVVNSCIWDITRYCAKWIKDYRKNLNTFFLELKDVVPEETLIIWNLTMPLGEKIKGGFMVPEVEHLASQLRYDVIEANFYSGTLADVHGMDVLDLHFQFRFSLQHRINDGIHWDGVAHRKITSLLMQHAAHAWGVTLTPPSTAGAKLTQICGKQSCCERAPEPTATRPVKKRKLNSENIPMNSHSQDHTFWNHSERRRCWFDPPKMFTSAILPAPPPAPAPAPAPPPAPPRYRQELDQRRYREDILYRPPHHMQPYWEQHDYDAVMRKRYTRHLYEPYNHGDRSGSARGYQY